MLVLNDVAVAGYARVCTFANDAAGLRGVVAIHSLARGPGAGGCRLWRYDDAGEAVADALRLARAMSLKNAMADLPLGGAKAVIMAAAGGSRKIMFEAFGEVVARLGGDYITAEDVGTSVADMRHVARATSYVSGISAGDPSPSTAQGVFLSMREAIRLRLGTDSFHGLRVAVQGAGHVGSVLCQLLHRAGANIILADPNVTAARGTAEKVDAYVISPARILDVACDVFAPCALGHTLDAHAAARLKAAVVCGAANNQLASDKVGRELHVHQILYVPDYVANAGGIIAVAGEYLGWPDHEVQARVEAVAPRVKDVLERARREAVPPYAIANALAGHRLQHSAPAIAAPVGCC